MADGQGGDGPPASRAPPLHTPDLQSVTQDWITIWQSELSALATDREAQEAWLRWISVWADAAQVAARLLPGLPPDAGAGRAGAAAPPGPTAPVAAPDGRDLAIQRLAERVAELERKLAERDAAGGDSGP